ncbi:MAG: DUF4294 domain-containing protein [Bacteroidales bacterium]|nr:DUF4294 domain-containing protein [Bacteroidales bacterium]
MRIVNVVILLILLLSVESWSQTSGQSLVITRAVVIDGDTIPHIRLGEINCWGNLRFKSKRARERYTRLVHNVRKTLPYARIAAQRITEIEDSLSKLPTKKLKEQYIKESEKKLFAEFEKPLKHLTISQGRILIKLIDRETGNTSYQLIKSLKGSFSAFLWQGVARLFGSSLKSEYDAEGDDKAIEYIVNAIDNGAYDDY